VSTPRKVLVVDDESNARNALAELLRDEGFDVETAKHGAEALDKVPTFGPEVLITDLEMPGMDGIELVSQLQTVSDAPLVLVMTSFGQPAKALSALRAGATDYLTKPIRFDELLVVLAKAFRLHDMQREIAWLRQREPAYAASK
jgi:CheY-like chemotaxis protein